MSTMQNTGLDIASPFLLWSCAPLQASGASAPASVLAGIDWFNRAPDGWRADLIIFGRGGGSFEDLYCFNDEWLVRVVRRSITGVRNFSEISKAAIVMS